MSSGGIMRILDPIGGALGLHGRDKKESAPEAAPARQREAPRTESVALRAQSEGQRATAGAISEEENDVNLLGQSAGPRRRSAGRALLG